MRPTNAGPPAPDAALDGPELRHEEKSKRRFVGSDPLAAHPGSAFTPGNPQGRSAYNVRAAIRRRTARRDLLVRLSMIVSLLGAVLYGAYSYLQ